MKNIISLNLIIAILLFLNLLAYSQHDHNHNGNDKSDTLHLDHDKMDNKIEKDTLDGIRTNHSRKQMMNGSVLLTVPMKQEASGTSWQPSISPMHMHMTHSGNWMFMFHGSINVRYTKQGGERGEEKFSAPNWFMISSQRKIGINDQIMFRTMLSLDRITEGGSGYPLLFQSGETWEGEELVDRQHPHDLFSELSFAYSHKFSNKIGAFIYLGYPGEPALGPPVFMHRTSTFSNPDATIGHHWQDATHITFGVLTSGIAIDNFKIEGSIFTGREPDENRFNFDKPLFDSYSGRISFNPTKEIALQLSSGFLNNPEGDDIDVWRTTASILFAKIFSKENYWSSSFIWGQNQDDYAGSQNSFAIESEYYINKNSFYIRLESIQKAQSELDILIEPSEKETIGIYTIGYKRKLFKISEIDVNIGSQVTFYSVPEVAKSYYGDNPISFQFYLNFSPTLFISGH